MQAYNAIPAKRMQHLANKLVHHVKMKEVEINVRNSNLVTSEVFIILGKLYMKTIAMVLFYPSKK